MAAWLIPALKLVLPHVGTIFEAAAPVFTKKKPEEAPNQNALLQQQITELQAAASQNAAHIKDLAAQLERLPNPVAIHCASGRRASLMGLVSWAQRTDWDAAKAAERGREAGLEISEADLSPLINAIGADENGGFAVVSGQADFRAKA